MGWRPDVVVPLGHSVRGWVPEGTDWGAPLPQYRTTPHTVQALSCQVAESSDNGLL